MKACSPRKCFILPKPLLQPDDTYHYALWFSLDILNIQVSSQKHSFLEHLKKKSGCSVNYNHKLTISKTYSVFDYEQDIFIQTEFQNVKWFRRQGEKFFDDFWFPPKKKT